MRLTNVRLIECVSLHRMNSLFCCLYIFIKHGSVPLVVAAERGHTETVQRLLELGANPNQQINVVIQLTTSLSMQEPCSVPLGIAAQEGHTETVQRLLEAGANPNHQNKVISDCHIIIVHYIHTIRL